MTGSIARLLCDCTVLGVRLRQLNDMLITNSLIDPREVELYRHRPSQFIMLVVSALTHYLDSSRSTDRRNGNVTL